MWKRILSYIFFLVISAVFVYYTGKSQCLGDAIKLQRALLFLAFLAIFTLFNRKKLRIGVLVCYVVYLLAVLFVIVALSGKMHKDLFWLYFVSLTIMILVSGVLIYLYRKDNSPTPVIPKFFFILAIVTAIAFGVFEKKRSTNLLLNNGKEYPGRIYDKKLFGLIKCYEFDYSDPKSRNLGSCYSFQTDKTIGDSLTVVGFVIYNDTYFEVYSKPF